MKKSNFKKFEMNAISTNKIVGGATGGIGTVTGHVPESGDPKDVTKKDWQDEGCPGSPVKG